MQPGTIRPIINRWTEITKGEGHATGNLARAFHGTEIIYFWPTGDHICSGVTRVKGQPGQLTNKQRRNMGEDELLPPLPDFWRKIIIFVSVLMKYYIQNVISINFDSLTKCTHLANLGRNWTMKWKKNCNKLAKVWPLKKLKLRPCQQAAG